MKAFKTSDPRLRKDTLVALAVLALRRALIQTGLFDPLERSGLANDTGEALTQVGAVLRFPSNASIGEGRQTATLRGATVVSGKVEDGWIPRGSLSRMRSTGTSLSSDLPACPP